MASKSAILAIRIVSDAKGASKGFADAERKAERLQKRLDKMNKSAGQKALAKIGKFSARAASKVSNLGIAFAGAVAIAPIFGAAILAASGAVAGLAAIGGAAFAAVKLGMDGIKRAAETAKPALDALKSAVSASIEQAMIPGFRSLATLMDRIQPQMVGLASTIGTSFTAMMTDIQTKGTGAIQSIITNAQSFIKGVTPGLSALLLGVLSFANQGAEVMSRFAPQINQFLTEIGAKLGGITADQIVAAFREVRDRVAEIWDVLQPIISAFSTFAEHATLIFQMAVALKALQIIIVAVQAATVVWTAVQWALNSALLANPLTWIVLAVVALVAVIVLIATKTTWFQTIWQVMCDFVTAAWNWVVNAVTVAWNWVVNAISVGINAIKVYFQTMWSFVTTVWNGIKTAAGAAWQWIQDKIMGVINGVKATFNTLKSAAAGVWNAIKSGANGVRSAIQWVIDKVSSLISALGNLSFPSPPGWVSDLFSAPLAALHGVPRPDTFTRFYPSTPDLTASKSLASLMSSFGSAGSFGSGAGQKQAGAGVVVNLTVTGAIDPNGVAQQIKAILTGDERTRGLISAAVL